MPSGDATTLRRGRAGVFGILAASAVATIGTRMAAVAIPWLVLVTTGDPVAVGLVSGAEMAPYVLSALFSAPLQDRLGNRRTSILADLISAATVAGIAVSPGLNLPVLVVLVAVGGALRAAGDRGRTTVLRPLIDQAGMGYPRITSAYEGMKRTSGLIGVSVGGVAIALLGAHGALWFTATTFVATALVMAVVVPEPVAGATATPPREPYWRSLRSGLSYYRSDRLLPSMTRMLVVTNLFNQASAVIFIPLWVLTVLHSPMALGVVAGAFAAGAIAGNVVFTVVAPYLPRYPAFVAGYFIGGAPRFLILALSDNLAVVVAVTLVSGFAMCSVNPTIGAVIYQRVPANMLARTNGILAAASYAGLPLGGIAGGLLVSQLGYANGVLIAATAYFIATLAPVLRPWVWREIDDVRTRQNTTDVTSPVPPLVAWVRGAFGLRVRLVYARGQWQVRARRGLRVLLPATPVDAPRAIRGLGRLDSPVVTGTVADLLSSQRAAMQRRARELRQRLELSRGLDYGQLTLDPANGAYLARSAFLSTLPNSVSGSSST